MARFLFIFVNFLMLSFAYGDSSHEFNFVSNKTNGSLSKEFINKIIQTFHPDIFFETGTYDGGTAINASQFFGTVITVEIYPPLFQAVQKKFESTPSIQSYLGNSSEIIADRGNQLDGTIMFWLDAHYSGEGTGMTNFANSGSPEAITPIREELKAIYESGIQDCLILIDDIRGFGTQINEHVFLGCWAYPTLQDVQEALMKINPRFKIALLGDTLLAYDASKYHPHFSPLVEALTKIRLYDGSNLTKEELHDLGKQIQNALPVEALFVEELYNMMSPYADLMFWHDIWYALLQLEKKNNHTVELLFQNAFKRIQSVTSEEDAEKVFQSVSEIWKTS